VEATDHELVALAVATGDREAFGELVRRHQVLVRGMLMRMTGNAALADDLSQSTFVQAWRKLSSYSGRGSFKGWLCRVAHTEFLQAHRKRKATQAVLERYHAEQQQPSAECWDSGDALDLDRALAQLSEAERTLIVMCYSCGLSHSEAAESSGMPLGTVKSHIKRGKEKLRYLLTTQESEVA